jgi:hypothetical protein
MANNVHNENNNDNTIKLPSANTILHSPDNGIHLEHNHTLDDDSPARQASAETDKKGKSEEDEKI